MNLRHDKRWKLAAVAGAALIGAVLAAAVTTGDRATAVRLPAVAHEMRAFDEPPLPRGEIPGVVEQAQANLGRAGHGAVVDGQTRRLAAGLGRNRVGIFAFPTTGGAICFVVSEQTYAATCVDSFRRSAANVRPLIYAGEGAPVTVAGLARNGVRSVKVLVRGAPEDAAIRGNAFYWQSREAGVTRGDVDALHVRQADGEVLTVNLDFGD